jgi:DNA polymerase III alpha subunit (gram-positive type)
MKEKRNDMLFAVYDTETTGLPDHQDAPLEQQPRVIEFGGIITDGKEIIDQLEFICNPGIRIEPKITEITGLTNADLSDKEDFEHYVPALQAYFERCDAVIAHNLSFDRHMLEFDLLRRGLLLPDIDWPFIEICTVEQTFHQYGRRMKLIELYELNVGEYVQKHRAISDTMLLHQVCQKIGVYNAFSAAAR